MNQHELNQQIEQFIVQKDFRGEDYSPDDIAYINQYEGSGGQGKHGAKGEGVLYEFYTPLYICELMWELAKKHGFNGGSVLEPSCATGRLFHHAPDKSKCVGFEINKFSKRIAEITYKGAKVYEGYFETAMLMPDRFTSRFAVKKPTTSHYPDNKIHIWMPDYPTWLPEYPFSLVIGNPPYGKYKNLYSSYFTKPKFQQIEQFFFWYGLQMLKKGGLLVYIVSSNFMRNGLTYAGAKDEIGKIADLVDAYRLPPVFKFSEVPIDIVVLRRK